MKCVFCYGVYGLKIPAVFIIEGNSVCDDHEHIDAAGLGVKLGMQHLTATKDSVLHVKQPEE